MRTVCLHDKCQRRLQEPSKSPQKYLADCFGSKQLPSSGEATNPTATAIAAENNEKE
jgi:hypothetical protein